MPVQSPQGARHEGVRGYPASPSGAHRLLRSGTLFPQASLRERSREPSHRRAHGRRGHGLPTHPADLAPSPSPTWMYAIFARATHSGPGMAPPRPLCPRRGERGGESKGGKEEKAAGRPQT